VERGVLDFLLLSSPSFANFARAMQSRHRANQPSPKIGTPFQFPASFVWGAATSAAQIEGAIASDGRGPSIWDVFCQSPGRVINGDDPSRACEFFHRWQDDIRLMQDIGLQAFRFSVSWSRVLPCGTGKVNPAGLDFYERLTDGLLAAGIRPFLTLYHWDLPQALSERGGWLNRESADWFADYAGLMAATLGDRVKDWVTFNEPQIFLGFGYAHGSHAPGLKLAESEVFKAVHHVNLAHGRAVQRLRERVPDASIGFAIATKIGIPRDESDPACVEAARLATIEPEWTNSHESVLNNAWWADPMIHGRYPAELSRRLPGFVESLPAGDLAEICQPLDFFGFNYYFGLVVEPDNAGGWRRSPVKPGEPRTMIGWPVHPTGLFWACKFFHDAYQLPLYVFENGISAMDWVSLDGAVHDPNRIDFLTRYLAEYERAHLAGIPLAGYFHWSLLDNFEWAQGYQERFGLIHVDFATQQRTLKDSAHWFRKVIQDCTVL
jgi:beta-glucosidase